MKHITGFYPRLRVDTNRASAVGQAGGVLLTETIRVSGLGLELSTALDRVGRGLPRRYGAAPLRARASTAGWRRTRRCGFHALGVFVDHGAHGTGEPLQVMLRPGNSGSNTAQDHIDVVKAALRQLPGRRSGVRRFW